MLGQLDHPVRSPLTPPVINNKPFTHIPTSCGQAGCFAAHTTLPSHAALSERAIPQITSHTHPIPTAITMPPLVVTFHSRVPPGAAGPHRKIEVDRRFLTPGTNINPIPPRPKTKLGKVPKIPRYFTINHDAPSPQLPYPAARAFVTSSSKDKSPPTEELDSGTDVITTATRSKRAKPTHVAPAPAKSASLTPLMQPIVARCLATTGPSSSGSRGSTPVTSPPGRKTSNGATQGAKRKSPYAHDWPVVHPYSRATDTRNDRSDVPSPREVARAEQAEKDRAKAREVSAAAARAAAAAKRKRAGKAKVSGSKTRSASPTKEKADDAVSFTAEPASFDVAGSAPGSSANPLPPRGTMKRTRSNGLGISTLAANAIGGVGPAVSSPLRAVTGPTSEDDEDGQGPERKRSRLGISTRRANTDSPPTASTKLGGDVSDETLLKTEPIPHAKVLPAQRGLAPGRAAGGDEGATAMRRVASASGVQPALARNKARTGSTGSVDGAKERARREVTLPGRLRDYDMKIGALA